MRRNKIIIRLALDSILSALYFILAFLTVSFGNIHLTFASLVIVFAATAIGLPDSIGIALLGEFLIQVLSYGITITTPLWILPPVIRALTIALFSYFYKRKKDNIQNHLPVYFFALIFASILTTLGNTLVMFLDAYIFQYTYAFVIYESIIRLLLGIATAIVIGFINIPLSRTYLHNM
ncbi:MAG: ECF transporter S component [Bacilli bacterium]